jgi:hypothetical protein
MLACGSCNMLLCGLVGGFDSALHAGATGGSFFHLKVAGDMSCERMSK